MLGVGPCLSGIANCSANRCRVKRPRLLVCLPAPNITNLPANSPAQSNQPPNHDWAVDTTGEQPLKLMAKQLMWTRNGAGLRQTRHANTIACGTGRFVGRRAPPNDWRIMANTTKQLEGLHRLRCATGTRCRHHRIKFEA